MLKISLGLYRPEDIHQQTLLAKFHENLTLPGGVDSILGARSQQAQKLNLTSGVTSDSQETLQGRSAGKYLQVYGEFFRCILSN